MIIKIFFIRRLFVLVLIFSASLIMMGCQNSTSSEVSHNQLTSDEISQGWKLIFDGKTFDGWRGLGMESVQQDHWRVEDGTIRKVNNTEVLVSTGGKDVDGGDLMTIKAYENHELYFEWRILSAGNSGLKYNVSELLSQKYGGKHSALGFEYQMLDDIDTLYAGKIKESQYTGSLYDMIPANDAQTKPVGEFNSSRILIDGNHVEHWLNGKKVVEYEFGSALLDSLYIKSKYSKYPDFHLKKKAHIVLQNHTDDAWFRNIKIREIETKRN
jgi:hypothetical protein